MKRRSSACCRAAIRYAARGWSVVPVEPGGKRPIVPWLELQRRRASSREIEDWFAQRPDANVGIVTGAVSGLVVLDVDAGRGGGESVEVWTRSNGPLPATVEALTGGGGRHLYFRHPGVATANRVGLAMGIDLRGDGGCVVAPPSLHASGRRYAWLEGRSPDEIAPAPMPDWLLRLTHPHSGRAGHPLAHWRQLVREGVDEGARNSTLASLAGHLLWHAVDAQVVLELLLSWNRMRCRPPLPDEEVASVVSSITKLHERDPNSDPQAS